VYVTLSFVLDNTKSVSVFVPYIQNHNFVERHGVLEALKMRLGYGLRQGTVKPNSRVSLFGLGGVGSVVPLYGW
jgi:hypothetical protein